MNKSARRTRFYQVRFLVAAMITIWVIVALANPTSAWDYAIYLSSTPIFIWFLFS